jgi:hypothetical protein
MTGALVDREVRFPDPVVRSRCSFTATFRLGRYTVRVRIRSATTRRESFAVAEVLTPLLTWTVLVDAEPAEHTYTGFSDETVDAMADELLQRAAAVLPGGQGGDR